MIIRRAGLKPLCRQCGHEFDAPAARCPMCGMRTGLPEPLRRPLRSAVDQPSLDSEVLNADEMESPDDEDIVLAPPVERPPPEPFPVGTPIDHYDLSESNKEPTPVARNVSVASLMLGTFLVAACLGLGRFSTPVGIIVFLILIPAYIRTLSAIWYFRKQERELGRRELTEIFTTSLVLALMGLAAGGLVFLVMTAITGLVVGSLGWENAETGTAVLGTAAAFATIVVLIHKLWPVNQD